MLSKKEQRRFQRLIRNYLDGKASPAEARFVESYYAWFDGDTRAAGAVRSDEMPQLEQEMLERLMARIDDEHTGTDSRRVIVLHSPVFRVAVAAALLLIVAGAWLLSRRAGPVTMSLPQTAVRDILPGGDKATLTLDNGQTIVLDSAANGSLAVQGQSTVVKLPGGQLAYRQDRKGSTASRIGLAAYNTLATPIGGQYRLTLPDGSLVWLNSASSIRYPAAFAGAERKVQITGEAYFEIKEDAHKPFTVETGNTSVQVLGTHFDIMSYEDEASINTTLVQGKVRVLSRGKSVILSPGQQAVVGSNTTPIAVKLVDADKETAWISGYFEFDQTDLPTLMRQLHRWYGIEPVYRIAGSGRQFGGRISRDLKLSEVLKLLQGNDIHFSIDGRKLIVLP